MENIQEMDRTHLDHNNEEACIGFYVDIIQVCGCFGWFFIADLSVGSNHYCLFTHQFTEAMPTSAEQVSSTLAAEVRQVCFEELLSFLQR